MRIERIELDGFGHFANSGWELSPGLSVLLGQNEAGKTTLLNAIRALLFGFDATREGRTWYPALAGGRRGGRLVVVAGRDERWTIERHGERGGQGILSVRAPNGNQGGAETLDRLLGRADRDLFNNIFAFGLGELESFASLSSEAVASRIYGAGSGLGGASAIDLERRLRAEQEAAYKPRGRDQALNRLLTRIEELRAQIAELERQPAEHEAAIAGLAALAAQQEGLRRERLAAAERSERLRRLLDAQPRAARLAELEGALADGDPRVDALPRDVELGLETRRRELAELRERLETAELELSAVERDVAELRVDEPLLAAAPEVIALRDERSIQEQRAEQRREALAAAATHAAELAEQLRRVGGWTEERLLAVDDSIAAVEVTREHERRLSDREAVAERVGQRVESARAEVAAAEREHRPADEVDEGELERRRLALAALPDLDRRLALLDERARLMAELGAPLGAAALPLPAVVAAVAGLVVIAAAGVALGQPLLGLIAGLVVGGALALLLRGRAAAPALPVAAAPNSQHERGELEAERRRQLTAAGLPPDADAPAIARAAADLAVSAAAARSVGERRARLAERREALERLEGEREAAASGRQEALDGWRAWLAAAGLPEGLSPEAARQVLNAVAPARRAADQRRREEERAAAISAAEAAFEARLEALLQRLGRELPATPALRSAALIALADELERSTSARRRGEELQRARQERAERRDALAERAEAADEALRSYLVEHGCADVDELRALAALAGERRELQQQLRETRAALVAIAGGEPHLPALLGEARDADPATLTAARDEAAAEVRRLEAAEAEALTREGALRAEVRRLEAAEELGARRQELAVAEAQAAEEARAWAVRAVALALLAETRHRYERERQPQVVRDAERYFATITDGRYPGIIAPPGEAQVLVEREQGAPLSSEQLSRGTAEQLYLALRFGLIEQFARNAEPLPVVMDDILVNFDPQRAERAARSIVQLAARHQVIFFTCHPRIAELLDPDAVVTQRLS